METKKELTVRELDLVRAYLNRAKKVPNTAQLEVINSIAMGTFKPLTFDRKWGKTTLLWALSGLLHIEDVAYLESL